MPLATGPAQSAYDEFGQRYQQVLAANGIEVVLLPSQGSSDNLRLLREAGPTSASCRAAATSAPRSEESGIESLGSLFVEPVVAVLPRAGGARRPHLADRSCRACA